MAGAVTYRNKTLLEACRELPCQVCGAEDGTVVAAHANYLSLGKGRSLKAADWAVASLCHRCHHEIDQGASLSKLERAQTWDMAHIRTLGEMFERGWLTVKIPKHVL